MAKTMSLRIGTKKIWKWQTESTLRVKGAQDVIHIWPSKERFERSR